MTSSSRPAIALRVLAALPVSGGQPTRSNDPVDSASVGAVEVRSLLSRLTAARLTRCRRTPPYERFGDGADISVLASTNVFKV